WSEDDDAELKKTLRSLLDRAAEATRGDAWKPPLLDTTNVTFAKGPIAIAKPGVYVIDGDVNEVETDECIILATGVVKCSCLEDSVVIAKEIQTTIARNSLLVAAESVTVSSVIGHTKLAGRECFVVAGKRIQARFVYGGTFYVISPEFLANPRGKPPVSAVRV